MSKVCKKCGRELPDDYKHKICENCMNQRVQNVKKAAKKTASIAGSALCVGLAVISKDKINLKK